MSESQTQYELIEPALHASGWGRGQLGKLEKEFQINKGKLDGYGGRAKHLRADYVLSFNGKKLAVVEAKERTKGYTEGVGQAKDYAQRLDCRFAYSTNGLAIYQIDLLTGKEGPIDQYPTPQELWDRMFTERNDWYEQFLKVPFETQGGRWQLRYYQEAAINRALEAVANRRQRVLLTLATGTGKTAIAFQIVWKLFQTRWNLKRDGSRLPRVLFLADRNILADQAYNSFSAFDEDALVRIRPDKIRKLGDVPRNGSIFFTIFQTFQSGPEEEPNFYGYPPDFFDFIIIDECHRGGANDESQWRAIMEYFAPAVQLGLTATPRRTENVDTYRYFGKPVYEYSLKLGINDGFLTPFRVKEITSMHTYTPDPNDTSDDELENREYDEADFNRIIEIKQLEDLRVRTLIDLISLNQKTLVFCQTQLHAAAVRDLINQLTDSPNPLYCVRVTADEGERGEQWLREFQDDEKTVPTVLTTSRKLSTGVDAPQVRNIVLMRPVQSMVEFKQIIGRGTRLSDNKNYFTIYDFVEAHKHFNDPEWDGPPLDPTEDHPGEERKPKEKRPKERFEAEDKEKPKPKIIRVELSKDRALELDISINTSFWSTDGKPMTAEQFVLLLFGEIPTLFRNESVLRKIWSRPDTRRKLLEELTDRGFSLDQLEDLRRLVHGENSDLYDVLAYVAYHKHLLPRLTRAQRAKVYMGSYSKSQQDFLNFVLEQYIHSGYEELDDKKLPELLELKYGSTSDGLSRLGGVAQVRDAFVGFQGYLYEVG